MSQFLSASLQNLQPYTPGEQPQSARRWIKLNTNESPFAPSPRVELALRNAAENLRLYPDPGCASFLQLLAATLGVAPAQVFAGNGSDEVLAFAFQAFCPNGAVFPDVTYGFYTVFAQLYGISYTEIPLREDFSFAVEDYAQRCETVFLANPNAPTGLVLELNQIEQLLQQNPHRLVVVDEAYVDFGAQSAVELLARYPNLLVVGTFSKSRSLAGARLGYAAASEEVIADLNRVKFSFNPYNINRFTLLAGQAALEDAAYFKACCAEIVATRESTAQALEKLGFSQPQSRANFVFVKPPAPFTAAQYQQFLRSAGILVRRFETPRTQDYVRITIGTKAQMQTLLQATQSFLQ